MVESPIYLKLSGMSQKRKSKRLCLAETDTTSNEHNEEAFSEKEVPEELKKCNKTEEITLLIDKEQIGVEAKPMRDLLQILLNRSYYLQCDNIYAVLSACSMFLFEELKSWIISEMDQIISPMNCLQIWVEMEKLDITPICCKAKSMSLQVFNEIINNGTITDLSLLEVCAYLGHINLQCDNELNVFQCAITWYHEHHTDTNSQDAVVILKMLLSCIDFKHASIAEILDMKCCQAINNCVEISKIFDYILELKSGKMNPPNANDESYNLAVDLVHSKSRYLPKYPCLLIKRNTCESNGSIDSTCDVIYYDKYKRKRLQKVIRGDIEKLSLIYYDDKSRSPQKLGEIRFDKLENLTGFGMQDYKSRIFIFGGEFCIGKGSWNREVWSFDMKSGKIEQKQSMPSPRRHFESCLSGDYFYLIGGTGTFRVIQDNMYWYEFKSDTWSKEIVLPCSGRQIKCCSINKQLFIFSLSDKCGYFFIQNETLWKKLVIDDPQQLMPKVFTLFCVFSYKEKLFLKGEKLIKLELTHDKLKVVEISSLPHFHLDDFFETVVSHNIVYTMYTHKGEEDDKISLESLHLDTLKVEFIFKFQNLHCLYPVDKVQAVMKLFLFHHYELVSHNTTVNF